MYLKQTFDEVFNTVDDNKKIIIPIEIKDKTAYDSAFPLIKREHHHFRDLSRGLHFSYFLNLTETIDNLIETDFLKQPSEKEGFFSKTTKNQRMIIDLIEFNNKLIGRQSENSNTTILFNTFGLVKDYPEDYIYDPNKKDEIFISEKINKLDKMSFIKTLTFDEFINHFVEKKCIELFDNQNKTIILPFIPHHLINDFLEYCRKNLINIILTSKTYEYKEKENKIITKISINDNKTHIFNKENNGIFYYPTNTKIVEILRSNPSAFSPNFETESDFSFDQMLKIQEKNNSFKIINSLFFESTDLQKANEESIETAKNEYNKIKTMILDNRNTNLYNLFFLKSHLHSNKIEKIHQTFIYDVFDLCSQLDSSCFSIKETISSLENHFHNILKNKDICTKYSSLFPTDYVINYVKRVKDKEEIKELIKVFKFIKIPLSNFEYDDFTEIGPEFFDPIELTSKYVVDDSTVDKYETHLKEKYAQDFFTINTNFILNSKKFHVLYKTPFEKRGLILRFVKGSKEIRDEIIKDFFSDKIDFDYKKFVYIMMDYGIKRDYFPNKP